MGNYLWRNVSPVSVRTLYALDRDKFLIPEVALQEVMQSLILVGMHHSHQDGEWYKHDQFLIEVGLTFKWKTRL